MTSPNVPEIPVRSQSKSVREPKPSRDYLLEVFDGCDLDDSQGSMEVALRSIGFLLQWATDGGNQPLSGVAGNGLAVLVQLAADRTRWLWSTDEAEKAGAINAKLPDRKRPVR